MSTPEDFEEPGETDQSLLIKSKTQIKREMEALQTLGVDISKLSAEQRAKIPLTAELRKVIDDVHKIKSNSAKKRHMQYIGKLMRSADVNSIKAAYQNVIEISHRTTRQLHVIEKWRDSLIEDDQTFADFVGKYADVNRQQLRQLIRTARKDREKNKPEGARKLFRFIRDIIAD